MRERGDLTTGNVFGRLVSFALPFLFSSFMQAFYGAVDMWTVGRFSTTANLAAVNTGAQVTQIVTGFCVGISIGTTVLIGHCVGAKNKKDAAYALGNSIGLFVVLAALLTPVMILGSGPITAIMQTPVEAAAGAAAYIRICGAGVPFIIAYNVISAILRGDGTSRMPIFLSGLPVWLMWQAICYWLSWTWGYRSCGCDCISTGGIFGYRDYLFVQERIVISDYKRGVPAIRRQHKEGCVCRASDCSAGYTD